MKRKVSILWILYAVALVTASYCQIYLMMQPNILHIAVAGTCLVVLIAGMTRSRQWVLAPHTQLQGLWSAEAMIIAIAAGYFFTQQLSLLSFVTLLAFSFQLVFRDYCGGIVQRILAEERAEHNQQIVNALIEGQKQSATMAQEMMKQFAMPLAEEPRKITEAVHNTMNEWRGAFLKATQEMNQELVQTAGSLKQELLDSLEHASSQLQTGVNAANEVLLKSVQDTAEKTQQIILTTADSSATAFTMGANQAAKSWLDGAQEASQSWRRATDTGVRCLADQLSAVAKQWEQQFELSNAWLTELQNILQSLRGVTSSWDNLNQNQQQDQKALLMTAQQLSQDLARFQTEFTRIVSQLTHEQKEWTLGMLNNKRYLQIDQ